METENNSSQSPEAPEIANTSPSSTLGRPTPIPASPKNNKVIWSLVLAVLILALGSTAWSWWSRNLRISPEALPSEDVADTTLLEDQFASSTPASSADRPSIDSDVDTIGWQTYRNEEYGFEFKYPVDLVLNSSWSHPYSSCENPIGDQCGFSIKLDNGVETKLRLGLMINFQPSGGLFIDEPLIYYSLVKEKDGSISISDETYIPGNIGRVDGTIGGDRGELYQLMKANIKNEDTNYLWWGEFDKSKTNYLPLFKQILSTFRFIN